MPTWRNWSGLVHATPQRIEAPASEDAVAHLLAETADEGTQVRVAGAGHSFSALVPSDHLLLSLEHLSGLIAADPDAGESGEAELWAGSPIHTIGPLLADHGLALRNQGDIDRQALGGACGTGTHGTGPGETSFSGAVVGATVVRADGEVVRVDAEHHPDLFAASRLSLGAVGAITRLHLAVRPAYRLHEREWIEPIEETLERLPERIAATRHHEFFWLPEIDRAYCKSLDETDAPADDMADVKGQRVGESWAIFPSVRDDRFNEMEYAVPAEHGPACFAALRELYRSGFPDVTWPIEYRTQAADDVWMSPAHGRATVTLSIHEPTERDHEPLFRAAEEIFAGFEGRPHWGKLSYRPPEVLAALTPAWDRWWAARDDADPDARFLNPHMRRLAGR